MTEYVLTVNHDRGIIRIRTVAQSEEAAIRIVMTCEGCPRRAITHVTRTERHEP